MKVLLILLISYYQAFGEEFSISLKSQDDINLPSPKINIEKTTSKQLSDFLKELDMLFGRSEAAHEYYATKSLSPSHLLYVFDLNAIKDKYLYTPITFKTSKDTTVYVGLSKAVNCPNGSSNCNERDKFLLTFTANSTTQFIKVRDIINYSVFASGSKKIYIDGDEYVAKIYAKVGDVNSSRVEVKGPKGVVVDKKLGDLIWIFKDLGYEMNLSKKYILVYGRKIECISSCRFLSSNMVFIFEFPPHEDSSYYSIDESVYNGRSICFESIGKNVVFNLSNGVLKVFKN